MGRYRLVSGFLALVLAAIGAGWPSAAAASTPNDPDFHRQWGLRRIGAPAAWAKSQGEGIVVAVVDTGVNYRHPDLAGNMFGRQYDSINDDHDAADLHGHGTGVAGVVAAVTNNGEGIAGVAPRAKIMAVRAFGATEAAASADVADGVIWAADNGAHVINLSLGGAVPIDPIVTDLLEVSILYATARGALVVAAAGNSAQPFCSTPAFNPAAICVGATDGFDMLTSFSSYFLGLDVVAPGQGIWTTGGMTPIGYGPINGTSFASPHVAGVGALLMSMGASNLLAGLIIRQTAKDLGLPGWDNTYGWGRVDARAAVELCEQIC